MNWAVHITLTVYVASGVAMTTSIIYFETVELAREASALLHSLHPGAKIATFCVKNA